MCLRGAEGSQAGAWLCTSVPAVGIPWGAEVVAGPRSPPLALAPAGSVGRGAAGRARWGLTLRGGDAPEPAVIAAWGRRKSGAGEQCMYLKLDFASPGLLCSLKAG